jgi:DNA-binding transcriptional LysR family regulator
VFTGDPSLLSALRTRLSVTLTQLRTFALVARPGSLRTAAAELGAAAAELGVSEPAVPAALAALRSDLADPLFVRAGGGIELTPGGRALAAHAREIVGLAARVPGAAVDVVRGSARSLPGPLAEDGCDVTLGTRPTPLAGGQLESVPFLRWQRVLVAGRGHRLAGAAPPPATTARWFTGPAGWEPGSEEHRWATATPGLPEPEWMESETDGLAAVRAGHGVLLALAHVVRADLQSGALVRVPCAGTPVTGMWWVTVPAQRATATAVALQRFLTTADAMTALVGRGAARRRPRPTVRVALWSKDPERGRGQLGS